MTTNELVLSGTLSLLIGGESIELSVADAEVETYSQSWHGIRYPSKGDEPEG